MPTAPAIKIIKELPRIFYQLDTNTEQYLRELISIDSILNDYFPKVNLKFDWYTPLLFEDVETHINNYMYINDEYFAFLAYRKTKQNLVIYDLYLIEHINGSIVEHHSLEFNDLPRVNPKIFWKISRVFPLAEIFINGNKIKIELGQTYKMNSYKGSFQKLRIQKIYSEQLWYEKPEYLIVTPGKPDAIAIHNKFDAQFSKHHVYLVNFKIRFSRGEIIPRE